MATCTGADSILEAAALIKANGQKIDKFTKGTSTETVQLGTGDPTPTLRKLVADTKLALIDALDNSSEPISDAEIDALFEQE